VTEPLGAGVDEPPNRNGAFPRLDEEQRARLPAIGALRDMSQGEVLFRDGDDAYDFFVVESGAVAIVQGYGCENRVIAGHGRHRFLGELGLLTGSRVYLTAVVRDPGQLIQVPLRSFLESVVRDAGQLIQVPLRSSLESAVVRDTRTDERTEVDARALFVFIGASPHTEWLGGQVACDEHGVLLAGRDLQGNDLAAYMEDRPLFLETSLPGVFAVGDGHSG